MRPPRCRWRVSVGNPALSPGWLGLASLAICSPSGCSAVHRILDLNAIIFQSSSSGAFQFELGLLIPAVVAFTRSSSATARSRCAVNVWKLEPAPNVCSFCMMLNVLSARSRACFAALRPYPALLQSVLRVAYFDANLLLKLLQAQLGLTILQLRAILVCLGHPISNRKRQVKTHEIVWGRIVEGIRKSSRETARGSRDVGTQIVSRIRLSSRSPCRRKSLPVQA